MDSIRESFAWKRFWMRLDAFAVALDYDPMEELQTRVAKLERELLKLRSDLASHSDRVDRP